MNTDKALDSAGTEWEILKFKELNGAEYHVSACEVVDYEPQSGRLVCRCACYTSKGNCAHVEAVRALRECDEVTG